MLFRQPSSRAALLYKQLLSASPSKERRQRIIWEKASPVPGLNSDHYRCDDFNLLIKYNEYGNRDSEYGWEFDHYPIPKGLGGPDFLSNLRPLHYRSNISLGKEVKLFKEICKPRQCAKGKALERLQKERILSNR